ncbi:MAG: hypothetical protein IT229_10235 [Flavobacteriales bacterium]|nr:hypothetical protein [Flavobacteriales bacterium]
MGLRSFCLGLLLLPIALYGQGSSTQFDDLAERLHSADRDSMVHVDSTRFRALVEHLCLRFKDAPLETWSDTDHINLMRSLNTIAFENAHMKRFHGDPYHRLETFSQARNYTRWITHRYPDWKANKGMGLYIPDLDMELFGSPSLRGRFNVQ